MYDKGAKYFNLYFLKMVLNKIVLYIVSCLNKYLNSVLILQNGMIILNLDLRKRGSLINAVHFLRDHNLLKFDSLLDIWGVDYPEREERFEVNYMLNSSIYMRRIWLKLSTSSNGSVDSVVGLFNSAGWLEREVWDMYGVYFVNNPDLRRILTDYGFEGYPLRKDFPLSGFTEVRYDDGEKRVISEKVELAQDYRYFSFLNPW